MITQSGEADRAVGTGLAVDGTWALTEKDVFQLEVSMDNLQQPIGLSCRAVGCTRKQQKQRQQGNKQDGAVGVLLV